MMIGTVRRPTQSSRVEPNLFHVTGYLLDGWITSASARVSGNRSSFLGCAYAIEAKFERHLLTARIQLGLVIALYVDSVFVRFV